MKKILILGGGFAGIETFRRLHKKLHPANEHGVQLELVNRDNYFTFSPMLHEAATGSVAREHVVQPLREVLVCCGKDFHQASVTGIDLEKRVVTTDQASHSYDYLVIALGVEQGFFGVPGAEEYALALKWLDGALKIRNRVINSFERASEMHDVHNLKAVDKFLRFIIVGGGATGTELAGQLSDLTENEMREFYGDVPHSMSEIVLVHAGSRLLEHLSEKSSALAKQRLERLGVKVLLNETATEVRGDAVVLKSGHTIPSNSVFWTAGTESLLPNFLPDEVLNERGLAKVDPTFELMGHEGEFVLGDAARVIQDEYQYPPTAQAAVQAAHVTADNIVARLNGKALRQRKYVHKGDIIPIGNWYGIFDRDPIRISGLVAWIMRRAVFLKTMYGWANRIEVAVAWTLSLFLPRDTSEF